MNKDTPPVQPHKTTVCGNLPAHAGWAVCLLTLLGCRKHDGLTAEQVFAAVQVHETRIAGGEAAVRSASNCREAHAPAEVEVCDPSVELCKLTSQLGDDTDAVRRCLMASDSCRAARERARALCATPAPP